MKSYNEILSDVTKTATKIPQSDYLDTGKYRIFDQGKEYSVGFSNDELGVVTDYPYIIFGDHTRVVKYVDEPCYIGADGVKLLKVINKCFDSRYVYYNILAKPIESQGYARHFKFLKEIQFTEKSFSEQQKIATELDTIQSAIDNKKQQLSLLDEAVKSEFVEMFGENPVESGKWKVERLQSLSKSGGAYGAQSASSEYKKNRPRYIRITDINEDGSLNNDVVCSSNNDDDSTYKLVKGDFLFARMGATVGKTYAYSSGDMIFAGYLIRFQLNTEKINPSFLFYFTKTEWYQKWVKNNQSGAAQPGINSNKYGNLLVPIPPLDLQIKFAAFVQQIDKSKFIVKQQISDLQELLDSKMQEYFI